jgi:hypothetical protein
MQKASIAHQYQGNASSVTIIKNIKNKKWGMGLRDSIELINIATFYPDLS